MRADDRAGRLHGRSRGGEDAVGQESQFARLRMVNAAKAAGVQAIDSVFSDVADMDGLRKWGEQSRAMGFEGMGCIHPLQIKVIHEAYAPSQVEIEKALKIVAAFEDAKARGLGVVSLGSKMIDPPVVNRAVKLVERARQMGLVQEGGAMTEAVKQELEMVKNAADRRVPTFVNGREQVPFQGSRPAHADGEESRAAHPLEHGFSGKW